MNKEIEELPQMQETLEDLIKTLNANDSWDLYCIGIKLREKSIWLEELTKKTNECWELQEELKQLKKQKDDVVEYIKYQLSNLDLEKDEDIKAKMLGSMILVMLEDKEC